MARYEMGRLAALYPHDKEVGDGLVGPTGSLLQERK